MPQFHKSEPEHYEGQLSEEASQSRAMLEERLASLYADARNESNPILRQKIHNRADELEQQLALQGANPKKVPFAELKEHVQAPLDSDPLVNKYKKRIKNRATAMRAFCIGCMGGDVAGVRVCTSLTCPLHPFRMGKDPFRGFEMPKPVEVEIEDEDGADEFEEGDDGSDADATT